MTTTALRPAVRGIDRLPRFRPINRSRSARHDLAGMLKRHATEYRGRLSAQSAAEKATDLPAMQQARTAALYDLLKVRAAVERAIWLETGGRMGDQFATMASTIRTLPMRGASHTDDEN
jgi:hypothetical protein